MISPLLQALTHRSPEFLHTEIGAIVGALVVGFAIGSWLEHRFVETTSWRTAARSALLHGAGMPLVALIALQLVRHASPWLLRAPLLKIALPVLGVWLLTRVTLRVAQRAFPGNAAARLLVRVLNQIAWGVLVLHLSGALPEIIEALDAFSVHIGRQRLTGWTLLRGVAWVAVTLVLALWVSSLLESRLLASPLDVNLRLVVSRLLRAAIFTAALLVALQMVGIDLTVLSVFGGALGVGLGLGLQRIAANYVSGFVVLFERSLRVGDNISLEGFQGRIVDIKTRYTLVRSASGIESLVPNEMLISNRIDNLSYTDRNVWQSTTVGVAYGCDIEQVLVLLERAAASVPRVLANPGPGAVLSEFGNNALQVTVGYWIADPENGTLGVRGAVNLALLRALREAGVDIPFPQLDVHMVRRGT